MIDDALLDAMLTEVAGGCDNDETRRRRAGRCIDFYRGSFEPHCTIRQAEGWDCDSVLRILTVMQQVVNQLTRHLYAIGPAREFPDNPNLTAWLQKVYQRADADAKLQEADRLAHAGDVAAIQAEPTGNPEFPVRFLIWGADEFTPFADPTDPTRAAAVATLDKQDEQRRFRLWTDEAVYSYQGAKLAPGQTAGGRTLRSEGSIEHGYGEVPFAFVRVATPTNQFFTPGPGESLARLNEYLILSLTDVGDSLLFVTKPILTTWGCDNTPAKGMKPGSVWKKSASKVGNDQMPIRPEADYLQPDPVFVEAHWSDIQGYLDISLMCCGVPIATFRLVQTATKSGAAIVAEQMPLILRAVERQRPAAHWERDLARATIAVGRAELIRLGAEVPAWLDPAEADRMQLRWPSMVPAVPMFGQQQAQEDSLNLALGLTSRIQLAMRKLNLPREQAVKHLQQVAADLKEEATIGLPPLPATPSITESATNADAD